jgi:hypothetical protein
MKPGLIVAAILLHVLGVPALSAATEPSVIGYWTNPDDPDDTTAFEPDRCIALDHGKIQYVHIRYVPGKLLIGWISETVLPYHFEGPDTLVIDNDKKPKWHRAKEMPAELKGPTVTIPAAKPIAAPRLAELKNELLKRRGDDQAVRKDPRRQADGPAVDHDNTAWLSALVQEVGWIDAGRFGTDAANAAFLIVQHSGDLALMEAALPLIDADRKRKTSDPQDFALLCDRVLIMNGRSQRYGSQIAQSQGKCALYPLEDRAHVDQLRKEIGLFPLATYLELYRKAMGGIEVTFMDDLAAAHAPK